LVYQRRKIKKNASLDNAYEVKNVNSMYPSASIVNNAYQPDEYKNGIFIEPVDPSKYGNADGGSALRHTKETGTENPVYNCYVDSNGLSALPENK